MRVAAAGAIETSGRKRIRPQMIYRSYVYVELLIIILRTYEVSITVLNHVIFRGSEILDVIKELDTT